jgi:hypothetical protein
MKKIGKLFSDLPGTMAKGNAQGVIEELGAVLCSLCDELERIVAAGDAERLRLLEVGVKTALLSATVALYGGAEPVKNVGTVLVDLGNLIDEILKAGDIGRWNLLVKNIDGLVRAGFAWIAGQTGAAFPFETSGGKSVQ